MYQKTVLVGRLGKDPETITFDNGDKISKFTMATSESWKDKQSGEWKESVEWHTVVMSRECNYTKGELILVEGKIRYRKYEQNGETKYFTEIRADRTRKLSQAENRPTPNGESLPVEDTNTSNVEEISPSDSLPFQYNKGGLRLTHKT